MRRSGGRRFVIPRVPVATGAVTDRGQIGGNIAAAGLNEVIPLANPSYNG